MRDHPRRGRAALPGLCLGLAASAVAAQSPDAIVLSPVTVTGAQGGLTAPTAEFARRELEKTPGAVAVVESESWRDTQATTLKDVLDYTPGVFVQPKWGEDSRLSIRGSGLSRNFHLRGVALLQNGVPYNHADGSGDFQEIDPTAYRYVEVHKGANALRYGYNALGGAINFVSATGRDQPGAEGRLDVGSFGFRRAQASVGGAQGAFDGFVAGSWQAQDGYRDNSQGRSLRAAGNIGARLADNIETRFFLNASQIDQEIPGSVTRAAALSTPRRAAAGNLLLHYERNIDALRLSNRTVLTLGGTTIEIGGYYAARHLVHPIFQYIDYRHEDYAGFARLTDERQVFGHANRLTLGVTAAIGTVDNRQFANLIGGNRGTLLSSSRDRATNTIVYAENSFDVVKDVSLIAGVQFVSAERTRSDRVPAPPDTTGSRSYDLWSPRIGAIWRIDPAWQVFANVSRSAEAPTLSELNFTNARLANTRAQKATTYEIGTRGARPDYTWEAAIYRANLRDELQFFDLGGGNVQVTNADRTIHQGIELAGAWSFAKGLWVSGAEPDRLWLRGAYTFSDFRFDGDPAWGDRKLPGAPRHYLRAELLYRHPSGAYVGPNLEWVPEAYFVDNANTQKTESYALLGLRAGYELSDHAALFVDARNLTDERYISSASIAATANAASALFEPGIGRSVYLGVRLKL